LNLRNGSNGNDVLNLAIPAAIAALPSDATPAIQEDLGILVRSVISFRLCK
jgi:hypothetical protein